MFKLGKVSLETRETKDSDISEEFGDPEITI